MKFDSSRLAVARKRRLLKKKELAEKLGVAPLTITRWENDQAAPLAQHIDKLVRILEFPKEFFFGNPILEPSVETTSFRSQTSMSASVRDAALAAGSIGFLISTWVEDRFSLPEVVVPDLGHMQSAEGAARALREYWGLGEKPISDMVHLLESKGVRVFSLAENTLKVNAYSLWRFGLPFVFLNTQKTSECSRFDAAHELGHIVFHQDGKTTGREAEDQANRFASSFLMPKADVIAQIPNVTHLGQLIEAKSRWRVSLAALAHRCHKLGIISDWKYRDFCIEIYRRYGRATEPKTIPRETSKVWSSVLKALWKEGVGQRQIAKELNVPEQEVNDLLFPTIQDEPFGPSEKPLRSLKQA